MVFGLKLFKTMDPDHLNLVLRSLYPGSVGLADPGGGVLHHQLPARPGSPSLHCHLNLVLLSLYPGSVGLADPGGGVLHHCLLALVPLLFLAI
jgi:hypothetical protein